MEGRRKRGRDGGKETFIELGRKFGSERRERERESYKELQGQVVPQKVLRPIPRRYHG